MNNLNAEKILEQYWKLSKEESIRSSTGSPLAGWTVDNIVDAMIDLAKTHVTAALEAATKNAQLGEYRGPKEHPKWVADYMIYLNHPSTLPLFLKTTSLTD